MNDAATHRLKRDRIERLRERVKAARGHSPPRESETLGIILGLLDLLADEL